MDHEAVFWDVGGVILDIDSLGRAQREFISTIVETYDLDTTSKEALSTWRDTLREHFAGRDGRTYVTAREGRRKAARVLFDGEPPGDWREIHTEILDTTTELNPGVESTMAVLDEAGIYQAIISDADTDIEARLARMGLDTYISHVTTSEEVGYVKPDPQIFETAFEKAREAGFDPSAGVMVGDKYDNDMEGASQVGLTTASYGAGDGPAVDHCLEEISDLLEIVGVESR